MGLFGRCNGVIMKERKTYLSLARVIGAIAVVFIHTNGCFYEFNIDRCWTWANVIESGLGFAVPVFIMVSGATLMDYSQRYSTKEYFKKRVLKTVIPYLVWSVIGNILDVNIFFIYYFFLNLFGVYLCIPLFSFLKEEYKEKVMAYVVLISFVFNYFLPFMCAVTGINYVFKIPLDLANGFLIYALIGYLIYKKDISFKWRIVSYVCSLIGFVLHIGGTYVYSIEAGAIDSTFRGYTNLPCLLMSVGVFVLIKELGVKIKNEKAIQGLEWFSAYTFPIYLIHFYIIELLMEVVFADYVHLMIYKLITPFITIAISIAIAWLIRKIPIVRKILP